VKLRLLKVVVQPVFLLDDGETLTELQHPPTAIPAAEWPSYSNERFPQEVEEWQRRLDADPEAARAAVASGVPSANGAAVGG
jgi:hypothetical protein